MARRQRLDDVRVGQERVRVLPRRRALVAERRVGVGLVDVDALDQRAEGRDHLALARPPAICARISGSTWAFQA